ncbi:MAG TPA: protein-glutamate O-methyltransferase CheR [Candidatus Wallbacteria bacterium]|nr:protein-glutamate O-methyltransferase CheR [Candidatus Wallbacteria bacterium]
MNLKELNGPQFDKIIKLLYNICGIALDERKKILVSSRLQKRLRELELSNFDEYIDILDNDVTGAELSAMVDALTTNVTGFFRELAHFELLKKIVLSRGFEERQKLKIWSAGCSSGEEAYSIAITLCEVLGDFSLADVRILATDISTRMLSTAKAGVYERNDIKNVSLNFIKKYFRQCANPDPNHFSIKDFIRKIISFARLNLVGDWAMKGQFDVIFCRNVMIYFDRRVQERLLERFWRILMPGGYLFIGHSESLTVISHRFKYVCPGVYSKE